MKISALPRIYKMKIKLRYVVVRIGVYFYAIKIVKSFLLSVKADRFKSGILQNVDFFEAGRFQKLCAVVKALL